MQLVKSRLREIVHDKQTNFLNKPDHYNGLSWGDGLAKDYTEGVFCYLLVIYSVTLMMGSLLQSYSHPLPRVSGSLSYTIASWLSPDLSAKRPFYLWSSEIFPWIEKTWGYTSFTSIFLIFPHKFHYFILSCDDLNFCFKSSVPPSMQDGLYPHLMPYDLHCLPQLGYASLIDFHFCHITHPTKPIQREWKWNVCQVWTNASTACFYQFCFFFL